MLLIWLESLGSHLGVNVIIHAGTFESVTAEQKGIPLYNNYQSSKSYRGQLELCPPDELHDDPSYPAIQVSFGLVSVFLHSVWGSLNDNTPLSSPLQSFEVDSICRQLGFTQAVEGSLRTVSSFKGEYNFSKCYHMKKK